jgi:hypothetical protein
MSETFDAYVLEGQGSVMAPAPARILADQVRGRVVIEMGR